MRDEIETKRNETKRNKSKRNSPKRNLPRFVSISLRFGKFRFVSIYFVSFRFDFVSHFTGTPVYE